MKKLLSLLLLAALTLMLCSCGSHKADCQVISAEFVDNIPTNGVMVNFEGKAIFKIVFNAELAEAFDGNGAKDDDFRKAMFSKINEGCKLSYADGEGEQVWGYWPEKASKYAANKMTLFYTVPEGTELQTLTFTMDGSVLGDGVYRFSYNP